MHRELCFLPDETVEIVLRFGNENKAWCYVNDDSNQYSNIEFSSENFKEVLSRNQINSTILYIGFSDVVPGPVWNKEEPVAWLDMSASYALQLILPGFDEDNETMSFGYLATLNKNCYESEDLRKKLIGHFQILNKEFKIRSAKKYVLKSAVGEFLRKEIYVSKNNLEDLKRLQFVQHRGSLARFQLVETSQN